LFRLSSWVVVGCGSVCDPPLHLRPTQLVSLAAVCQQQAARCVLSAGFVPKLTIIEWCGRSFLYCVYPLCTAVIPVPVARLLSVFVHLVAPLTRYPVGGGEVLCVPCRAGLLAAHSLMHAFIQRQPRSHSNGVLCVLPCWQCVRTCVCPAA
jgi:hypothetical protein